MSNIKKLLDELQDNLLEVKGFMNLRDQSAIDYLNKKAGIDPEWLEHREIHGMRPSANCSYRVDNADLPSPDEERMSAEEEELIND